jgi:YggT family protein
MFVLGNLLDALAVILHYVLQGYMWIVIIRALLSWVNPDPYNPIVRALYALTDPVLSRLRRRFPLMAGSIDFSPWVVILVIMFLDRFLVASLAQLALRLR